MIHSFTEREGEKVLAVADEDLVGETLSEGDIDFVIARSFYGGEEIDREALENLASESTIINAVGKKTVSILVENNFIDEERVIEIEDVPHAQMVRI